MRIAVVAVLLSLSLINFGFGPSSLAAEEADTIFINGNVYTVNEAQPKAEAIAVKAGKILFVGSNVAAKAHQGNRTQVIDLAGKTVVPGLTDSHYHLAGVGLREMTLNLEGTANLQDFLNRIRERAGRARPGEWITGRGWIETFWTPPVFPTRWDLDKVAPKNPVYLVRADGHGGVANSAAIKIAKVTKGTANPFGGEIMKDKKTGEPNGMFLDKAQALISRHVPQGGNEQLEQALILGVNRSLELGWCQIQNAGSDWNEVQLLRKLYREGKIKLRIYESIRGPSADTQRLLREGGSIGEFGGLLTIRHIKVSIDGALGSKGAALLEPYADHDSSGFLTQKEDELSTMFEAALRKGIQIETHAIGDRANRTVLDLYEKALKIVPENQRGVADPRWRIEHAQILHLDDIPRFAKLRVIPSMQPSHAIGDLHFAPSRVGLKRLEGAYAWQTLLKSGSIIAGGSDAPVERGEPMIEFYAAVSRRDLKGFSGEGWHPEQRVSREDALKMFTIWAAYASFEDKIRGSIEVGKAADLTVLTADIMKIPEPEILKTRCAMTVVAGNVAFRSDK